MANCKPFYVDDNFAVIDQIRGLNSNCFEEQMRTYQVTRGPHYDADTKIAVPETYRNSFLILFP